MFDTIIIIIIIIKIIIIITRKERNTHKTTTSSGSTYQTDKIGSKYIIRSAQMKHIRTSAASTIPLITLHTGRVK